MLIRTYIYFKENMELDENGVNTTAIEFDVEFESHPDMLPMMEYYIKKYNPFLIQCTNFTGDTLMYTGKRYQFYNREGLYS